MKIFISSVIGGFAEYRDAAAKACRVLGHEVIRAEEFQAAAASAQQVCLEGVRLADLVILILGARYGEPQSSGLSPTHEEFREAKPWRPVLAFIQEVPDREPAAAEFVREVQEWKSGMYTAAFTSPEELAEKVTAALHHLELARATGPVDEVQLVERARALVPHGPRGWGEPGIFLIVAGGPVQSVLRPSEVEAPELKSCIQQAAMFGDYAVFNQSGAVAATIQDDALRLEQGQASILLTPDGCVRITGPARDRSPSDYAAILPALIEEEVQERIERSLRFGGWLLDQVDGVHRLTDVVILAGVGGSGYYPWRTRAEHQASPNQGTMGGGEELVHVALSPPARKRGALQHETSALAKDLTVLLRRRLRRQ